MLPQHTISQTEGVIRAHAAKKALSIPNYSTINRRVNKLDIEIKEHVGNDIVIALDSTGIEVRTKGEWIRGCFIHVMNIVVVASIVVTTVLPSEKLGNHNQIGHEVIYLFNIAHQCHSHTENNSERYYFLIL